MKFSSVSYSAPSSRSSFRALPTQAEQAIDSPVDSSPASHSISSSVFLESRVLARISKLPVQNSTHRITDRPDLAKYSVISNPYTNYMYVLAYCV